MKILAISGSIRKESSNGSLLKTLKKLLTKDDLWFQFKIDELPYFEPQKHFGIEVPSVVCEFRLLVKECDFIFISTPEYAHGIPGVLKNALEWLICEESMKKKLLYLLHHLVGVNMQKIL